MIDYQIIIEDEDYTENCSLPFKEQYVLDSALDNAVLTLTMTNRKEVFRPFTKVTIKKDDDEYDMFIASDKVTEIIGAGYYNHDLVLIEETKLLEKKVVDTNTTTQPLIHDYFKGRTKAIPYIIQGTVLAPITTPDTYLNPLKEGESFAFVTTGTIYRTYSGSRYRRIYKDGVLINSSLNATAPYTVTLEEGLYRVDYEIEPDQLGMPSVACRYSLYCCKEIAPRTNKSITDVVNRLLAITETLRENESPKLVFNQEQADFYDQRDGNGDPIYPAPEFSMTKSTLRECLDQVGGYIHSIVRLKGNEIYFDKLGGTNQQELDEDYIGHYETLDCEQYASQLDSIVSNLVNINDEATGTITEPLFNSFKTVRAESSSLRIGDGGNDTTAIIKTDYPIEKIEKLVCGYINISGEYVEVGDITPYVYESAEYGLLSSNSGTYPISKGFAITYTQGQKNITGLTFKLPNVLGSAFSNQAILNIIATKLGITLARVQDLFNVQNITRLHFQLIYYPSTTARVKQSRTDINNYSKELTSIYNQNANKVDSRAYGENLKGAIARLGNIEKFITYELKNNKWTLNQNPDVTNQFEYDVDFVSNGQNFSKIKTDDGVELFYNTTSMYLSDPPGYWRSQDYRTIEFENEIPQGLLEWLKNNAKLQNNLLEVGSYVIIDNEDYYVATIGIENLLDTMKVTVGLSKDFNALSKYIGIKNNIRMYEISEKQIVERFVLCEDYCVIGEENEDYTTSNLYLNSSKSFQTEMIGQFVGYSSLADIDGAITCAELQGIDINGISQQKVILPVFSLAFGNSIWLGCKYEDNYSAGDQSVEGETGSTSSSATFYRLNQPVRYTDYFGEIEKLNFKMYKHYWDYALDDSVADTIEIGNTYPGKSNLIYPTTSALIGTFEENGQPNDVILKKDNRETIELGYQLHFVTNDGIIIGSQLAQGNPAISSPSLDKYAKLYILPYRLNKFANDIDLTNATLVRDYHNTGYTYISNSTYGKLNFANETANADGKSWALIDNETGRLLFGKNIEIENGDTIEMPALTFTHKY